MRGTGASSAGCNGSPRTGGSGRSGRPATVEQIRFNKYNWPIINHRIFLPGGRIGGPAADTFVCA